MKNYIYGIHAVHAALKNNPSQIKVIYVQQGKPDKRVKELLDIAAAETISVQSIDKKRLDSLAEHHQGILAETIPPKGYRENDLPDLLDNIQGSALILILDGITDPHNLGAILRSAEAAGVHAVIAPKDNAVGITPVVRKVASGAAEVVPFFQITNLARTMLMLQERGIWIYGTDDQAQQTLYQHDLTGNIAIVMGSEDKGMRRLTREHCDHLVKLPMAGQVSSLNVSVATGVCLFEAVRQRIPH